MSPVVANEAKVATKLPGAPFWKYTLNRKLARKPTKQTTPVSATPIMMAAANRGTTRRRITETPMTSMASVSSRMVREPRSAVMADPTAAAIRMAAVSEAACRMTASPLAAPASEVAPTWPASRAN